jgi:hypothetical protein
MRRRVFEIIERAQEGDIDGRSIILWTNPATRLMINLFRTTSL